MLCGSAATPSVAEQLDARRRHLPGLFAAVVDAGDVDVARPRQAAGGEAGDGPLRGAAAVVGDHDRRCRADPRCSSGTISTGPFARCRIASRVAVSSLSVSKRKLASRPMMVKSRVSISVRMLAAGRPTISSVRGRDLGFAAAALEQRQHSPRRACARRPPAISSRSCLKLEPPIPVGGAGADVGFVDDRQPDQLGVAIRTRWWSRGASRLRCWASFRDRRALL